MKICLALDVFDATTNHYFLERIEHLNVLEKYDESAKTSKMGENTITGPPNLSSEAVDEKMTKTFCSNFHDSVKREDCQNSEIRKLVSSGKLKTNKVESFKNNQHAALDKIYADLIVDKEFYLDPVKLLKYALLITTSAANVKIDLSVLILLATKQQNQLSRKTIVWWE